VKGADSNVRPLSVSKKSFRPAEPVFKLKKSLKNWLIEREGGLFAPFTLPQLLCRPTAFHGFLTVSGGGEAYVGQKRL